MQIKEDGYVVAVVGATGAVGREMVKTLEAREFPVTQLRLFASKRSAGEEIVYFGEEITVEELGDEAPDGIDIALFSAGGGLSKVMAPKFADKGAIVIDNSSAWRMEANVPLVVPEVNPQAAFDATRPGGSKIIANPNCSTIQLVVALKPLSEWSWGTPGAAGATRWERTSPRRPSGWTSSSRRRGATSMRTRCPWTTGPSSSPAWSASAWSSRPASPPTRCTRTTSAGAKTSLSAARPASLL